MKFQVTIDRDEDGVWIVECPAIPGCVSQGDTRAKALRKRGCRVDFVVGASTSDKLFGALDAKRMAASVAFTTDDGSYGEQGRVSDVPRMVGGRLPLRLPLRRQRALAARDAAHPRSDPRNDTVRPAGNPDAAF